MREVEAKFRVHSTFHLPELSADEGPVRAVSGPAAQELRAVYWDTSDLRLAREGITLRHRSGEGRGHDGWHLKLPVHEAAVPDASTGARDEIVAAGPDDTVPDELRQLVEVHLRGVPLGPVATLVTARATYQLCGSDGGVLAELTDDDVSVLNQGHVAGRFREIEVEDRGGGGSVLMTVGTTLRAAGAVGGEFVPKVVRALGPRATADPDPPPPGPVSAKDPARLAVTAMLRRYVRLLMAQDPAVRQDRPDGVHQMRVAARRLRSALKTFRPLVDERWARGLRDELKWLADNLGAARDSEVMLARLMRDMDALPPDQVIGPVRARIESTLGAELAAAGDTALATLRSERYLALVDRLVAAAWDPLTLDRAESATARELPRLVAVAWARLARDAARLSRSGATDDDWHEARIAAKQVRYAAEAVVPFLGKPAKQLAKKAEDVQELLGEHQDAVVASQVIRRLATAPRAGNTAFTFGLLYARQQEAVRRTRDEFPALWANVSAAKHRKWLAD